MRKKPEIKVFVHWPDEPAARKMYNKKLQEFYIEQVEKQLNKYDLEKEQKLQVLDVLIDNLGEKLATKSMI